MSVPNFEEWVTYCFEQGLADWRGQSGDPDEVEMAREARFTWEIPPGTLAGYVIRLFESPAFIADEYAYQQIADGFQFIFSGSDYFHTIRSYNIFEGRWTGQVDRVTAARCYQALGTLYRELFDRVCCRGGREPDVDVTEVDPVDRVVYMIWDMSSVEGALYFPEKGPHLVEPGFGALEEILQHCRTSTCHISALHGLGHIHVHQPTQVEPIIDRYLARGGMPDWVRDYAQRARRGAVI